MRLFRWNAQRRPRVGDSEAKMASRHRPQPEPQNWYQQPDASSASHYIPDIEVHSTTSGRSTNFLNSSGGSLLLSDAIREARRKRYSDGKWLPPLLILLMKQQKVWGPVTLKPVNGFFSYLAHFEAWYVDFKIYKLHWLDSIISYRNSMIYRGSFT